MDALQKDIKDARFWDSEIQKEGLVWTRLWQHAYKAVYWERHAMREGSSKCIHHDDDTLIMMIIMMMMMMMMIYTHHL